MTTEKEGPPPSKEKAAAKTQATSIKLFEELFSDSQAETQADWGRTRARCWLCGRSIEPRTQRRPLRLMGHGELIHLHLGCAYEVAADLGEAIHHVRAPLFWAKVRRRDTRP